MKLYLLRHGIAEDKSKQGPDAARELTSKGKKGVERAMQAAARAGVKPDLILTSPLVRARQTAEIARAVLGTSQELLETRTLVPEGEPQLVWAEVCDHRNENSLLLVSHSPLVDHLLPFFLDCPTLQIDFQKSALAALEIGNFRGQPDGVLQFLLTPDLA